MVAGPIDMPRGNPFLCLTILATVATLAACGGAGPTQCPMLLPAAHLWESNCAGGNGYCFVDHEVPF